MTITITNPTTDPYVFTFTEPNGVGLDQDFNVNVDFTPTPLHAVSAFLQGTTPNFADYDRFLHNRADVHASVTLPVFPLPPSPANVDIAVPFAYYNRVAAGQHQILKTLLTLTDNNDNGTDTIQIWVDLLGVNDAPTAIADSQTLSDKFSGFTFSTSTFTNNDDDPDTVPVPDTLTMTSAVLVAGVTAGPGTVLPTEFVPQAPVTVSLNTLTHELLLGLNRYYQFLTTGESVQFKVHETISDGHGGTSATDITFTIAGTATTNFTGTNGANQMLGENDRDVMHGLGGKDVIIGRGGPDDLFGGGGNDIFKFDQVSDSGKTAPKRDQIFDFAHGDKIDLSGIDAKAGGADNKFTFIGNSPFHHHAGELHFVKFAGYVVLEGDVTGDGKADFQIEVQHVSSLANGDLVL